jgi:hypothetical protein
VTALGPVEGIADLLRKAYSGEAWHGPSVKEALAGVGATEASAHPLPRAHSVWELVLHITFWKDTVRRRLEGEPVGDVRSGENWREVRETTEESWKRTLDELARRAFRARRAARIACTRPCTVSSSTIPTTPARSPS